MLFSAKAFIFSVKKMHIWIAALRLAVNQHDASVFATFTNKEYGIQVALINTKYVPNLILSFDSGDILSKQLENMNKTLSK